MAATVAWFNPEKGYGFADDEDGNRYFLHSSKMNDKTLEAANKNIFKGKLIEFEIEPGATARGTGARNIRFA